MIGSGLSQKYLYDFHAQQDLGKMLEKEGRFGMNIYVGNLSYGVSQEDLQKAFEVFGNVESSKVIMDMYTGRSKGFGFVEMPDNAEAHSAIEGLDGKDLKGRTLKVNKARARSEGRPYGGNRGGGRQGGGRRFY